MRRFAHTDNGNGARRKLLNSDTRLVVPGEDCKPKVMVTCPTIAYVHKAVVWALMRIVSDSRVECNLHMPGHRPFENNLNHIVNEFMDGDFEYWISMDSDNPPDNTPVDLVFLNKDIIGLPTPIWKWDGVDGHQPIQWNAYNWDEEDGYAYEFLNKSGLQKVDCIGTGCFVVHRRVFEHPEMRKGPFLREWNEDGTAAVGNDLAFCNRLRKCGFEVWTHYDYPCSHYTEINMRDIALTNHWFINANIQEARESMREEYQKKLDEKIEQLTAEAEEEAKAAVLAESTKE